MMPHWYAGFYCYGRPQIIVDQIATKVRTDDLGRFIPRICLEKRPQNQFCLFVAIESNELGKPPDDLRDFFSLPALRNPIRPPDRSYGYEPFTREQLKKFVGTEANVQDYARRISYRRMVVEPVSDPFGSPAAEESDAIDEERIIAQTTQLDRLLLWMSAAGSGSVANFQRVCRTLNAAGDGSEARRLLRRLRLLGHIECSRDGSRWSITPTVLTRTGAGDNGHYVLCGGRDLVLVDQLRKAATLFEEIPQPSGAAPALIRVLDLRETLLATASDGDFHLVDNSAEQLAMALPSIADWSMTLQTIHGIIPAKFKLKWFDGVEFVEVPFDGESGFYEFWPLEGGGQPALAAQFVAFYDAATARWFRGDWYGLRYLAHFVEGELSAVRYDVASARLAIPEAWRWPEIYERAVVLGSGQLPTRRGGWLVYESVVPRLAETMFAKLGLVTEGGGPGA